MTRKNMLIITQENDSPDIDFIADHRIFQNRTQQKRKKKVLTQNSRCYRRTR